MLFLANQELRPRLQPPPCWLLGKLSDVAEAGGSLSFRRRQSLPSMGAPSNVGCSGREQEGAGLTDTQSPGLGLTHRQESFAFSHGGRGRVPRSTTPKLVPRSMYVCVSRSPGCAWGCHSTGTGTRGGVLGAAGSAQPISPRAKTHSPCPHPAAGPPHSPWGLRHHRPLSPPPVALPAKEWSASLPSSPTHGPSDPSQTHSGRGRPTQPGPGVSWSATLSSASPSWAEGPAAPPQPQVVLEAAVGCSREEEC